ncbi:MAG: hypothetical protein NUV45_01890 [Tepidanaerobacteraceae bacterium]|jgi:F-type H+-transporting ATPase subunit epsilon|nr:hypothetical protein [Tepidanaerobacteraceae bacterium]
MPFEMELYSLRKKLVKKAKKVVVPGLEGDFAVLARHAPLIAAVRPGRIKVEAEKFEEYYNIGFGLMMVRPEKTIIVTEEFYEDKNKNQA